MVKEIADNMVRVIVLDISGVYVQIYDQGYFDRNSAEDINQKCSDTERWHVLIIE